MKKFLTLLILSSSATLLHANCSNNQNSYNQGYSNQGNYQQGYDQEQYPQGQSQNDSSQNSDQMLAKQIQDSLHGVFSNKYNNVNVSVNNGNVTLQGFVATQEDRTDLEQKVRAMNGVRGIDNQVIVQTK